MIGWREREREYVNEIPERRTVEDMWNDLFGDSVYDYLWDGN